MIGLERKKLEVNENVPVDMAKNSMGSELENFLELI